MSPTVPIAPSAKQESASSQNINRAGELDACHHVTGLEIMQLNVDGVARDALIGLTDMEGFQFNIFRQKSSPSSVKSFSATSRNPAGMHPVNWLPLRRRSVNLVRLPNSGGIDPVNWLPQRDRYWRLARLLNSGGIDPVNWLPPRARYRRLARLAQLRGYRPGQLVAEEHKPSRFVRLPSDDGIVPVNWLLKRLRSSRLARSPNSGGIVPVNWLS